MGEQNEKQVRQGQGQTTQGESRGQGQSSQTLECCGTTYQGREQFNEHRRNVHGGEGISSGRRESSV